MTESAVSLARERVARLALLPLLLTIVVCAALCRWHTPFCVDNRTYAEMIAGVVQHGLPYTTNGRPDLYPELQTRWLQFHNGRLWGSYPPVYPYFAAPFYRLGGLRLVTQANIALLAVVAIAVFALTRRLVRDPLAATVSAYAVLLGTHVWTFSFDASPYTLMIAACTGAVYFAVEALHAQGRAARIDASVAGFLGGIAAGSQLLSAPIVVTMVAALFFARQSDEAALFPSVSSRLRIDRWMPSREAVVRGSLALLGLALVIVPIVALNLYRFGAWSPLSNGTCVWRTCANARLDQQGLGAMIRYNLPFIAWAALTVSAAWWVRESRVAVATVWGIAACALIPPSALHDVAMNAGSLAVGFVFDVSLLDLGLWRPPDRLGQLLGPFAVKALLQSAPVLIVALAVRPDDHDRRRDAWIIGICAIAMLVSLVLRGHIVLLFALGFPYLDLRYVTPLLPLLAALTACAVEDLPWRRWHLVAFAALGIAFWFWNFNAHDDLALTRRLVVLRGSLVLAGLALLAVVRAQRAERAIARQFAMVTVVAAAAFGVGLNLGVDLRAWFNDRNSHDEFSRVLAAELPQRFGLIGLAGPGGIDGASALRGSRDMQYADIEEVGGQFERFRPLVDAWFRENRPVYVIMPLGFAPPWRDVDATLVDPRAALFQLQPRRVH